MTNRPGPRILGDAAYVEQEAAAASLSMGMGPRVLDTPAPAPAEVPEGAVSVKQMQKLLEDTPAHAIKLFEAETARAEGPRIAALRLLRSAALRLEDADELVAEIDRVMDGQG